MSRVTIQRHITPADLAKALRADVRAGLSSDPKQLPPKWFYDARGSDLFEEITKLEEYYLTNAERSILATRANDIAKASRAQSLIELGAGSSAKTRLLLDAFTQQGTLQRYVPVDVSGDTLPATTAGLAGEYPRLRVHGVVADFERHLDLLPGGGRRLIAFLGSTIGNLLPDQRHAFFVGLCNQLAAGDSLLLGTDLVKDPKRLLLAYDEPAGVTAEFNRNVLHVINRELGADFEPDSFEHVAVWDVENEWIEMRLRSCRDQAVRINALDMDVTFEAGEEMRTEVSAKFRRERVTAELRRAGLVLRHWWTDDDGDFALSLAQPRHRREEAP